jgi:tetratricopeptide (TPR) repeat protein
MEVRTMLLTRLRRLRWLFAAGAALATNLVLSNAIAEPFVPQSDETVVERLPAVAAPIYRELQALLAEPANLDASVGLARKYIRLAKQESDPRYYGYAEGALARWWNDPAPPATVLTPRAMIKQSRHDFEGALRDLERALQAQPTNMQAWLARAAILRLLARFEEAKSSCMPLADAREELLALTCVCEVESLNGRASQCLDTLAKAYRSKATLSDDQRQWTLTVLAETAARLESVEEAEAYFKEALSLPKPSPYLTGAYADFLLDQNRLDEAIALLSDKTTQDALLLRLALAKRLVHTADLSQLVTEIGNRFEIGRTRGENLHPGDEARFALYLEGEPAKALTLAKDNWSRQRTPQDARILLEAAFAANQPEAARPAIELLSAAGVGQAALTRSIAGAVASLSAPK